MQLFVHMAFWTVFIYKSLCVASQNILLFILCFQPLTWAPSHKKFRFVQSYAVWRKKRKISSLFSPYLKKVMALFLFPFYFPLSLYLLMSHLIIPFLVPPISHLSLRPSIQTVFSFIIFFPLLSYALSVSSTTTSSSSFCLLVHPSLPSLSSVHFFPFPFALYASSSSLSSPSLHSVYYPPFFLFFILLLFTLVLLP